MKKSSLSAFKTSLLLSILFFLMGIGSSFAQTITIEGTVVEELSGEPIPGANVYFENTTTGASTDQDGFFSFKTYLSGKKTLIISFVGFHKASYSVDISENNPLRDLRFELRPKRIEMDDVVISVDNSEWQENYEAFVEEFIGTNRLASETTILNRWVLDFVRSSSGELSATASEPLIVENRGLGYRIEVDMKDFLWKLNNDTGLMLLDLDFTELTAADSRERQQWTRNRERAFNGSLPHFLQSLFHNRLTRNQFEVVEFLGNKPDDIYDRGRSREVILALIRNGYSPSDLGEEIKAFRIPRPVDILYGMKTLREDNRKRARLSPQNESGIFLVRKDGTFVDPRVMGVEGYWRTERLANKLPTELVNSLLIN
jgi:hypothetical protein